MLIKQILSQTSKWSSFFCFEASNESWNWNDRHLRDSGKIWMKSQTGKEKKKKYVNDISV